MSTRTRTFCDIADCGEDAAYKQTTVSVVFTTEQDEGRSVPPYLQGEKLDFCAKHYQQYINTMPLWAEGAMGYNRYSFEGKTR